MASFLFAKGKQKILDKQIDFDTDTIKFALVSTAYTPNAATHEFYSDLAGVLGIDVAAAGRTITGGVFDADDALWAAVAAGSTAKGVAIYKDTGVAGTSPLLGWIDQITGFPLATNGGDITVQWDNGANKIFAL